MKRTLPVLALIGAASFATTGCGLERSTSVLAPSTVSSAAGSGTGVPTGSLVGTWASSSTTLPSPTTCGNFQYQITSQTATAISGTFSGVCGGGVVINGIANGQLNGTVVSITVTGTAAMPGIPTCMISLSGTGAIEDNGTTLRVPFTGTTCLGPVSGVEVLHKPQPAAEPTALGEPSPVSPSPNQHLDGVRTRFTVNNASRSGPVGAIAYQFEVANDEAFASQFGNWNVAEQPNQTVLDLPKDLSYGSVYYWHVRASDGTTSSPWSRTLAFATPNPPPPPPGGGTGGGSCLPKPTTGPAVIACATSQYPAKLAAGVSGSQRLANMEFMRDRVIEIGICGGMDIGWNLKRGGPSISSDAIVWRHNGFDDIIDIGLAFDDTSRPLQLQWVSVSGAFYKAYTPRPACR